MVAVLGLKDEKKNSKSKAKDKKSGSQDNDAQDFLKELEEKQKAAPDKCLFC